MLRDNSKLVQERYAHGDIRPARCWSKRLACEIVEQLDGSGADGQCPIRFKRIFPCTDAAGHGHVQTYVVDLVDRGADWQAKLGTMAELSLSGYKYMPTMTVA